MRNTDPKPYPNLRAHMRELGPRGQEDFAERCNTTVGYIRKFMSRGCELGVEKLTALVIQSKGAVPPDELCQTVDWKAFARIILPEPKKPATPAKPRVRKPVIKADE